LKLQNKIAVITGGNSGIGWAAAQEFKAQGARVIIIRRNAGAVAQAAKELGGDTLGVTADISGVADIDRAFHITGDEAGCVNVLFVNSGIAKFALLADSTEALFDEMTDTNVKGAYFTVQRALPLLSEGASVIFASSAVVHFGMCGTSIYAAGKGALNSIVKTLALELASRKIRVNVLSPYPIATPIVRKIGMSKDEMDKVAAGILAQVPLGRFGEAVEIARAVAFLASSESSDVTGTELLVDDGMSQQ
jgi:NAD(P)-dependent dehydrogenase (short-subunit alcohol dehydrogenase family)